MDIGEGYDELKEEAEAVKEKLKLESLDTALLFLIYETLLEQRE